ncbi:MAG: hypothetical protein FJ279_12605, partial [Planctomycetes bacterium]|nr:hypothetical protein [Planctomycetota bacterium]
MNRNTVLLVLFTTGILSVHLSNIWRLDTYPFTDLPNHLAEAYLFRVLPHADEPLREYYRVAATFFTPASLH